MQERKKTLQTIISDYRIDPFGTAVYDFVKSQKNKEIIVHSPYFEDDVIDVSYLFRNIDSMPKLEQKALSLCRGRVLDVGAGAGCHTLELQKSGFDVTAVDISKLSVDTMQLQGIKNVRNCSVMDIAGEYDTILLLMNGVGIAGSIAGLQLLLQKLYSILRYDGVIILDSSDVSYLFEMEDGSYQINLTGEYYGTIPFQMSYEDIEGEPFSWLYIDGKTLELYAEHAGFSMEVILAGDDGYSYLAKLKKR